MSNSGNERYLAVYQQSADVAELEAALKKMGIRIEDQYEFIRTFVLSGDRETILKLPQALPWITGVERERTLRAPE